MDKITFDYSTKNIPSSSKTLYSKKLIEKTELFLKRLRWKALFYLNPEAKPKTTETFGFKSRKVPPTISELKEFEHELINLIRNIKFKNNSNGFQQQLKEDIKTIKRSERLTIAADKTNNFYKMSAAEYNNLLEKNVCNTYKKADDIAIKSINNEAKTIASKLELDDRIETMAQRPAFITLKDHKPNFSNNPSCRLINPAKSEIGHISKAILSKVLKNIVEKLNINLWKNTTSVLEWFKGVQNKKDHHFICFDVVEFYPSISEKTLIEAIKFASKYTDISAEETNIILQAKKSLLFHKNKPWNKKSSSNFDVTMGSFDGAETCELVGSMILFQLNQIYGHNIGLYRDDGLAVFNETPRKIEIIKKNICKIFSKYDLKVTIEANKKVIDFLDVTLNLNTGRYMPFTKPNNNPRYVHKESNHPPNIIKNIPLAINKRLADLSSDPEAFNNTKTVYQNALKESGYKHQLTYPYNIPTKNKRSRTRKITWYNPPFDLNVKTNIGHEFLKIVKKIFHKQHPLNKIFNKNTLKLSYSCMPNIKNIIDGQNKQLNNNNTTTTSGGCNCRVKNQCPLQGECLTKSTIYQAQVTANGTTETYVGLTEGTFKARYNNHKTSFNNASKRNSTELSKYLWSLKDNNTNYTLKWKILKQIEAYSNTNKKCNLCIGEKYYILFKPELSTLNKRNEIVSTCRHSRKFVLNSLR